MIAVIDAYRGQFGVELICCTLWAAAAGFSPHVAIGPPKAAPPDRAIRDEMLIADLRTVHQQNFSD